MPRALQAGIDLGLAEDAGPDDAHAAGHTTVDTTTETAAGAAAHAAADIAAHDDRPAVPWLLQGMPLLLREAVLNLVDNALRYAGRGAEVTVAVRRLPGWAEVEVSDTGPGLPDAQLEAVFGRFVRATHEGTGCGLGLAIVREIAQRHGGAVHLQAAQPHGLRAVMRLPLTA